MTLQIKERDQMWECPTCGKDHAAEVFEFVHRVNRFGRSLGRVDPMEPRTIGDFFATYGEAVKVETAEKGRHPAPWLFMAPLNDSESLIGVIPLDEYLHEELYPQDLGDGKWMTSDGRKWEASALAQTYEATRPTPISDMMERVGRDVRAIPQSVLKALISAVDPAVWNRVQADIKTTPPDKKVPVPFPYSTDGGESFHFSSKERLTVPELLFDQENQARERRRMTVLEKAMIDAKAQG